MYQAAMNDVSFLGTSARTSANENSCRELYQNLTDLIQHYFLKWERSLFMISYYRAVYLINVTKTVKGSCRKKYLYNGLLWCEWLAALQSFLYLSPIPSFRKTVRLPRACRLDPIFSTNVHYMFYITTYPAMSHVTFETEMNRCL